MGKQTLIKIRKTLAILLLFFFAISVTATSVIAAPLNQTGIKPLIAGSFTASPTTGAAPLTVQFTDQTVSTAGISTWKWDFGDGATSVLQNPTHTYNFPGTYTVKLTATDANGGAVTYNKPNFITVQGIKSDFKSNTRAGPAPLNVDFTDLSSSDTGIKSWLWDFGDGTTSTLQTPPTHTYNAGSFTVKLTATDGAGNSATEVKKDYIVAK
jgi:PKD repeat protein